MSAAPGPNAVRPGGADARRPMRAARFDRRAVSIAAGLLAAIPVVALLGGGLLLGNRVAARDDGRRRDARRHRLAHHGRPAAARADGHRRLPDGSVDLRRLRHRGLCVGARADPLPVVAGRRPARFPGRPRALLGTQSIIAVVVFGRFSQSAAQSLGLAAYVLTGGSGAGHVPEHRALADAPARAARRRPRRPIASSRGSPSARDPGSSTLQAARRSTTPRLRSRPVRCSAIRR